MKPACVSTCQPGALHFGPRDEMIKLGKERVEFMKSRGYDKAELYGEKEMGGLHILQVCKFGREAADLPADPEALSNGLHVSALQNRLPDLLPLQQLAA